jgi:ATP-dependent Zn proteases
MDNKKFLKEIKEKEKKLEEARLALKEKFVGIDSIIDKVINSISLWYIAPEFQLRPCILSLWGTTGVGKTDLVRTLVNLLKFSDKFIEIQMDKSSKKTTTIQDILETSGINSKDPCILLLDELQKFRQLDEEGKIIEDKEKSYTDIWTLLSDGKFASNSKRKEELIDIVLEDKFWEDYYNTNFTSTETKKVKKRIYKTQVSVARNIKNLLKLDMSLEDIMKMDADEKVSFIHRSFKNDLLYEGDSYEKMLIFISGNLDEAFQMSCHVDDADLDADIYHEFSKKINVIDIKAALKRKFKPEQIARFGNNHIIYPCLSKNDFYKIIKKRCDMILNDVFKKYKISINLDANIYDIIYQNGVFPTQGVRPVLSTVSQILDNSVPYFLFVAIENDVNELVLKYEDEKIIGYAHNKKFSKNVDLDINKIREGKSEDEKKLVIVHELGHALVYTLLFGVVPNQINFNSTSMVAGFIMKHSFTMMDKTSIKKEICTILAGMVAEEIVFGENIKTSGSVSDIQNATNLASEYVRSYAMDGTISKISSQSIDDKARHNYNIDPTNLIIENILTEEKKNATDLINNSTVAFKELINFAITNKKMNKEDFLTVCKTNSIEAKIKDIKEELIQPYNQKLQTFLNE